MPIHEDPLLAAIVSGASMILGICLFRWVIRGLLTGEFRYRFQRYDRYSRPVHFWCAAIWGFAAGVGFSLGGLAMLYLVVMKTTR